jgi:NAD-dependent dihydropyrimidine dehydrogenase PreA subunit
MTPTYHGDSPLSGPVRSPGGRQRLVAIVGEDCTGCQTCVDICLVDCIEPTPPTAKFQPPGPIHIREDECLGCFLCAKVCEELEVNAIRLVPFEGLVSCKSAGRSAAESAL